MKNYIRYRFVIYDNSDLVGVVESRDAKFLEVIDTRKPMKLIN